MRLYSVCVYYTLAERWHCEGSSQKLSERHGHPSPGPSPQVSWGKHSTGLYLPLTGLTWWVWCSLPFLRTLMLGSGLGPPALFQQKAG